MRRTKIVATLGPATDEPALLRSLIAGGVDVVRLNAAHSGPGELRLRLDEVRAAASDVGRIVGVLLDLPGPKIRVGEVAEGTRLMVGAPFVLGADKCVGDAEHACVTYAGLAADVERGNRILVDDGRIELLVTSTTGTEVHTEVVSGGELLSNKGVNVPGALLRVEAITRLDRTLLAWACANDVDWVAQSFVRTASDVRALRELMTERPIPVCAKIEKHEATSEIERIVVEADAVMVARGDLAVETSPERVPVLQRRIVHAARAHGRPVIIATEMLDSMRHRPRPTRAEASDVAAAVFGRADALMLSAETAVGEYPVASVETMGRIISTAEAASGVPRPPRMDAGDDDVQAAVSAAACALAADLDLAAIVTLTQSGATARSVARYRPDTPIIAVTPSTIVAQQLSMVWGIQPLVAAPQEGGGLIEEAAVEAVRSAGFAHAGDRIAVTAGIGRQFPGGTDSIHVRML